MCTSLDAPVRGPLHGLEGNKDDLMPVCVMSCAQNPGLLSVYSTTVGLLEQIRPKVLRLSKMWSGGGAQGIKKKKNC
jgi:hypothetical protein